MDVCCCCGNDDARYEVCGDCLADDCAHGDAPANEDGDI